MSEIFNIFSRVPLSLPSEFTVWLPLQTKLWRCTHLRASMRMSWRFRRGTCWRWWARMTPPGGRGSLTEPKAYSPPTTWRSSTRTVSIFLEISGFSWGKNKFVFYLKHVLFVFYLGCNNDEKNKILKTEFLFSNWNQINKKLYFLNTVQTVCPFKWFS